MKRRILTSKDWKEKHGVEPCGDGIGWSDKEQKFYGYSHRGVCRFGVGDIVKEGDVVCSEFSDGSIKPGFKCETLDDCERLAKIYTEAVSYGVM